MSDDQCGDELRRIWQNQLTGTSTMTVKLIRSKARDLRGKTRRHLFGAMAATVAIALVYAFAIRMFPSLQWVIHPLFASALAWSLAGLYFLSRGVLSAVMPANAGLNTGLEFCRQEIERRRRLLRRILLWSFGPMLLAIGTFTLALALVGTKDKGLFPNGLPFLILVVIWLIAYFVMRVREQNELTRELEELNDLERDSCA